MGTGVGLISTTGVPNTQEYRLGGGDVYLAELTSGGMPKSFRKVGNCPTFTVTATTETYEHDSVQGQVPVQDASVPIRAASSIGFSLQNLNAANLAMFFLGDTASYVNPAIAGFADVVVVEYENIVKNSWYQIYGATGKPVLGITATNNIVLQSSASTPLALTKNTDYTVDAVSGKIFLMDTAAVDAIIAAGASAAADGDIECTLTADAAATTVDQVTGMTNTTINVAVHIQTKNAFEDGLETTFQFHKVSLVPDGDLGLIAAEAAAMSFSGQVQTNAAFTNDFDVLRAVSQ